MRDGHLGRQRNGQPFVDLTEGVAAEFIDQSQPAIDLQLIANGHAEEGIDNHPLVQAVHEQLVHGGLIIAADPHSGPFGGDDFSSAPAVGVQEMVRVTLRH